MIAPVVVSDGVALRENDDHQVGSPARVLTDRPQRLEGEALLSLDSIEQGVDGSLVKVAAGRALVDLRSHPGPDEIGDAPVAG